MPILPREARSASNFIVGDIGSLPPATGGLGWAARIGAIVGVSAVLWGLILLAMLLLR